MNNLIKIQRKTLFFFSASALLLIAIFFAYQNNSCYAASSNKNDEILFVKTNEKLPDTLYDQRLAAFKILRPLLKNNLLTANVLWQEDNFSFSKKASLSSVYISDYLNNKITAEKLIEHISIELLEPDEIRNNAVSQVQHEEVLQINCIISDKLRDTANYYRSEGKTDSALRIYRQVIELNPNDYLSLYWIGEIYKQMNNYDLAKEYYTRAISLSPDFKSANDALYEITQMAKAK
jgi:tetratricopeptide (TPR) repeat protein